MKIKYFLMAVALLSAGQAAAQETYENAKIAGEDLNGTARYVGMGGALDALGADIYSIFSLDVFNRAFFCPLIFRIE